MPNMITHTPGLTSNRRGEPCRPGPWASVHTSDPALRSSQSGAVGVVRAIGLRAQQVTTSLPSFSRSRVHGQPVKDRAM
jgi:hypothetical protein